MLKTKVKYLLYTTILFLGVNVQGQNYLSPYSKFGLGELQSEGSVRQRGMGGVGVASMDSNLFSIQNPASFSRISSFTFETALSARIYEIQGNTDKFQNRDYLLPYFTFALPLDSHLKWGLNFGLKQYSKIGYQFQQAYTSPVSYNEIYQGTGGYSKFFIGSSIQLVKNLFLGANVGYFFGRQQLNQRVDFDSITPISLHRDAYTSIGSIVFEGGAIYKIRLKSGNQIQLGVSGTLPANLKAKEDIYANTVVTVGGTNYTSDSLVKISATPGVVKLPAQYGLGIQWKSKKWLFAADYHYQSWSQFRFYGRDDSLKDLSSIGIGAQWTPGGGSMTFVGAQSYFERISYRAGLKITNTFYNINNNQPIDFKVSAGLGLPVGYKGSALDIAFEYGQIGSLSTNGIQQKYYGISLGFHLYDAGWFYRRKID